MVRGGGGGWKGGGRDVRPCLCTVGGCKNLKCDFIAFFSFEQEVQTSPGILFLSI